MSRWILLSMGGLLLWASSSWAVSKVGGGILSNDNVGFLSDIPRAYSTFNIFHDQDVRMDGKPFIRDGVLQVRYVIVHLLSNEQPQWVGKTDRQEFHDWFSGYGWQRIAHAYFCVEQWERNNGNSVTRVLGWGDGRGVIFTSTVANAVDVAFLSDSLKLQTGVCSWK